MSKLENGTDKKNDDRDMKSDTKNGQCQENDGAEYELQTNQPWWAEAKFWYRLYPGEAGQQNMCIDILHPDVKGIIKGTIKPKHPTADWDDMLKMSVKIEFLSDDKKKFNLTWTSGVKFYYTNNTMRTRLSFFDDGKKKEQLTYEQAASEPNLIEVIGWYYTGALRQQMKFDSKGLRCGDDVFFFPMEKCRVSVCSKTERRKACIGDGMTMESRGMFTLISAVRNRVSAYSGPIVNRPSGSIHIKTKKYRSGLSKQTLRRPSI